MSDINNTAKLREWFRTCPLLLDARFNADYAAGKSTEYAIFSVPSSLKTHENILGKEIIDDIQTQNFIFVAELPFGADTEQNLQNLGFMQAVTAWIIEQNAARIFPEWEGGKVKGLVPTLTGAPVSMGANSAKYQIQLKVTYRRR